MSDIVSIISKYVDLKHQGRHWVGLCPFHKDRTPSLKVTPEKNIFKCWVCGEGGSASHFIYEYNKRKGTNHRIEVATEYKPSKSNEDRIEDWKIQLPVPSYIEPPMFRHIKLGVPNGTWRYTDINGKTMFYTCRFNLASGGKEVLPYSYCIKGINGKWMWKGMGEGRPLYNLFKVVNSNKPICLVEGEKTVDAGNNNSNEFTFASFQGGSNAYKFTDFTSLKGKDVVLLRDNDEAGLHCMRGVYRIIKPFANKISVVTMLSDMPDKWDIADKQWEKGELDEFIVKRITI